MMGKILEETRNNLDSPALNRTREIEKFSVLPSRTSASTAPIAAAASSSSTSDVTAHPVPVLENSEHQNSADNTCPTVKELSASIKPTVIPGAITYTVAPSKQAQAQAQAPNQTQHNASKEEIQKNQEEPLLPKNPVIENTTLKSDSMGDSNEELMDIEGVDTVSVSSVFSELSDFNDVKNLTHEDGSLNLQKIAGWTLPSLNTSKLLSLSKKGSKESKDRLRSVLKSQNELTGNFDLSTSTPRCDPISKVQNRRRSSRVMQGHVGGEKSEMTNLLRDMNLI